MSSVHTNTGAMAALQALNSTNRDLQVSQSRINTGLKVATAKDNGAIYNIAQQQRSEKSALDAVRTGLDRAKSIADVAMAAGEALSDLFVQMRDKAVAAADPSASVTSRAAYNQEFLQLRDQVLSVINNAVFDGANLLGGPAGNLAFQANTSGTQNLQLPILDLRLPATPAVVANPPVAIYLGSGADIDTQAEADDARQRLAASLTFVNSELARLGAAAKRIDNHSIFVGKLQDSITSGIGNLVDADLATESARLQSLQVKQQLGTQALSIANQAPQTILSLFRN